jgi:sporulation protein YlmC with PRC-barrel domain
MAVALLPLVAGLTMAANNNVAPSQTNQPIQQDEQVATSPESATPFHPQLEKAKDLIGSKVVNDRGEELGKVADVVLTPDRRGINYVVLSHDSGTWGMADKYFAVPWSKFTFKPGENGAAARQPVLTGVSKADLDRAPGFDKDHWPATASENWLGIEGRPGMTPSAEATTPPAAGEMTAPAPQSRAYPERGTGSSIGMAQPVDIEHLRLSKVIGMKVSNLQGEDLGKLDNVVIDVGQGKLAYGIVAMRHGFLGLNKDFAAVPWSALDLTAQPGIARLDANRDTLMAGAFEQNEFPNLADPQYSRQLFDRFRVTPYWEGQGLGYIPGEEDSRLGYIPGEDRPLDRPSKMTPPNTRTTPDSTGSQMIGHRENGDKCAEGHGKDKHAMAYNPNTVQTIHGTIRSVGSYPIPGTSVKGVLLHVNTEDGRTLMVQVGPQSYVDRQNIRFHPGDPVTITGSLVKVGQRESLLAARIQTSDRTLDLRTREGRPLWDRDRYESPSASGSYDRSQDTYRY